jgi:short-subunit dehydrogenase
VAPRTWSTALVTGASSGIGEQFARTLATSGTDLVVVARRQERLRELAGQLESAHGVTVEVLPADLTDAAQRAAVEVRLADRDRPVDLLVNNAGLGTYGPFIDQDVDREDAEIQLNVVAVTRLAHAALPAMVARGHGGVVNVASVAGFQPLAYNAVYSATKAYVLRLSEALHEELRGTGVHVTALCPGFVRTEFQDTADVERGVPRPVWLDPADVVTAGLDAVDRDQAVAVPGLGYKLLTTASRIGPRSVVRRIGGAVARRL